LTPITINYSTAHEKYSFKANDFLAKSASWVWENYLFNHITKVIYLGDFFIICLNEYTVKYNIKNEQSIGLERSIFVSWTIDSLSYKKRMKIGEFFFIQNVLLDTKKNKKHIIVKSIHSSQCSESKIRILNI